MLLYFTLPLLVWGLVWGSLCLILVATKLTKAPRLLGMAALVCALHASALALSAWQLLAAVGITVPAVNPLYHPIDWLGQAVALLFIAFLLYVIKWVTPAEVGLRWFQSGSLRVTSPVVGAVALALFADAYFSRHGFAPLWWHEQLFYSTIPGLEEELFYRGVLPGMLGRVFSRSIPLLGTRTNWGGLVGVVLFVLGHGIKFSALYLLADTSWQVLTYAWWWQQLLRFSLSDVVYQFSMGLLFLWVRERTGSVWPAVASHCLMNSILSIGHAIG